MKNSIVTLLLIFLSFTGCASEETSIPPVNKTILKMVDSNATPETKALYSQLWTIQTKGTMFGHHDDLLYGTKWMAQPGGSDIKDVCGDFPAVFSVDFAEIMDNRSSATPLNLDRERVIKEAYARGEVIIANCHLNNPLTGRDSWDNSNNTVAKQILIEGNVVNVKFKSWLDKLANFVNNLKDENGKLIPIIFRPFHEHTQTWSWWGSSATTQQEFIGIWKYTIDYLKNQKNVHSLIYAISPQLDELGSKESLLFRWPGDDYVDFIGMDSYHGTNTSAFSSNLRNLGLLSKEKQKPCGVTETGLETIMANGVPYDTYWTNEISTPLTGKNVSMVVMWRNKFEPGGTHYFAPFKGHSSSTNFKLLFDSPHMLFSKDLPDMYKMAENVTVE
jgi:mannan endo-1,4-beta-mannosidase